MKALIFAAGLGTRLRPFTDHCPKALVELNGVPMLEIVIKRLQAAGCTEFIINIHHFGEQIINFLAQKNHFGCRIICSDERGLLLDTGGGLRKAAWFFADGQPFFIHNADIISDIDLSKMYQTHLSDPEALATLAVQARESSRCLLFDDDLRLSGRTNTSTGETWLSRHKNGELFHLAFSGIHVCSPRLLPLLPQQDVFSIMTAYVSISEKYILRAFRHDGGSVIDAGKPENMARAAALAALILSDKK